jgi:hypothetical protein
MTVVIAWAVEALGEVLARDRYGHPTRFAQVREARAVVWCHHADDTDVEKALKHAATLTHSVVPARVLFYGDKEPDPLGKARTAILSA